MANTSSVCLPCLSNTRPSLTEREAESYVSALKALAHPVRLRMVDLIHQHGGELCVCEFEVHFNLTQPTISHHLKVLRQAGVLRSRQDGPWVRHSIEPDVFARVRRLMETFAHAEAPV